jgi:hypothetical protein
MAYMQTARTNIRAVQGYGSIEGCCESYSIFRNVTYASRVVDAAVEPSVAGIVVDILGLERTKPFQG